MTQREIKEGVDLDQLLHPARAFGHPSEVVNDPHLTLNEKRAILASWGSDACAVEANPVLREPSLGVRITYDEIMDALKQLDREAATQPDYGRLIDRARRIRDLYRGDSGGGIFMA